MDSLGIAIKKDSWAVAHVKSSFLGVKLHDYFHLTGEDEDRIGQIKRYISDKGLKGPRIAVALQMDSAMTGVVNIPAPNKGAVEGILNFELERHIPFQPEETHRSFQIIKEDKNVFSVFFAAAGRGAIGSVVKKFTSSGLEPSSVIPWQTAVYNCLYAEKALSREKNTLFIWIGSEKLKLEVFESYCPVYSRSLRLKSEKDKWIGEVKKEIEFYMTKCGGNEKRLAECIFINESILFDGELSTFLTNELGFQAQSLKLKENAPPSAAPAIGAGLTALGFSRIRIDLGGLHSAGYNPESRRTIALGFFALLLLVTTGASYPIKDWISGKRLEASIADMQYEKKKAEKIAGKLKTIEGRIKTLEEIERSPAGVLETLKELTVLLPRDTYLTGFEYNGADNAGGTINIEGVSGSASSVILTIEHSDLIKTPEFAGPVVKTQDGKERFRIKFAAAGLRK